MLNLLSDPIINFEIFGTINPTKEIIPATETADAASKDEMAIDNLWTVFTRKPSDTDNSSPRFKIFNSFDISKAPVNPAITNI